MFTAQIYAQALFSVSLGKPVIPKRNLKKWLCKILEGKQSYYGQ